MIKAHNKEEAKMKPEILVRNGIYDGAIAAGATELSAKDYADSGVSMYRRNQFASVSKLITNQIKGALKVAKAKK